MVNTKIRLIIFFAAKDKEALYSQQKQDQELTVAQIMNSLLPNSDKLQKVRKTTKPLKGLDLIRVPDDLWTEVHDIVQETEIRTIPKKKKCKKQNGCLRRPYKKMWKEERQQRRKGKIYPFECRVTKNSKERQESLPQ